jgi:uncharacterized protein (TIGR04141 family)
MADESEGDYNRRAARAVAGTALLDRVLFRARGARTPIELADLAIGNRLVHVKRKTSSSTLSHLFAQGHVAAEAIKADRDTRTALIERLAQASHPMATAIGADRLAAGSLEVTYAIVAEHPAALPGALPFFSKLNLVRARDFLESTLDFDVATTFVRQP